MPPIPHIYRLEVISQFLWAWLSWAHSFILEKRATGRRWALTFRRTRILRLWLGVHVQLYEAFAGQTVPLALAAAPPSPAVTCCPLCFFHGCVGKSQAHVKEKQLPKGMRREKSLSSYQLVCLLLPFLSQTTGCLELIYWRPNPLQLSHSSGKLSSCCVVWCAFGLLCLLVR